ncbi:hypothetical protein H2200_010250 [Cladophialophora chaetospira]|uniref:Uncharacterized protein n=1 Tax=Cladophialophora chaetospira TaxID=386627 RepID=A0AA38X2M7_9EURO|nr:hypothetical protein H2200_010250 [Cladophialophora chaetospira]
MSFDGLPAEIRLQVYRYLFQGRTIIIRAQDNTFATDRFEPERRVKICRDRALGLNIMFASKMCLAEAKQALLNMATFNVDLNAMADPNQQRYTNLKSLQGFSTGELASLRAIAFPEIRSGTWRNLLYRLVQMPQLRSVSVYRPDVRAIPCPFADWVDDKNNIRSRTHLWFMDYYYLLGRFLTGVVRSERHKATGACCMIKVEIEFVDQGTVCVTLKCQDLCLQL